MTSSPFEVVMFDLGGVLVELAGVPVLSAWIGESREEEVWRRWLECPWVRRFERGHCSTEEFGRGMVETWELPVSAESFLDHYREWPLGLFDGAQDLVDALAGRVRRACFSNTNELHWRTRFHQLGLDALFDDAFLSFRMQQVKPDPEAFQHVVDVLGVPPERILFLDDNQINVDGARSVGLRAERALGVPGARTILARYGLA